ncbi:hypothetical protein MRX96_049389 [Rhipicephalus microplus]
MVYVWGKQRDDTCNKVITRSRQPNAVALFLRDHCAHIDNCDCCGMFKLRRQSESYLLYEKPNCASSYVPQDQALDMHGRFMELRMPRQAVQEQRRSLRSFKILRSWVPDTKTKDYQVP